MKEKSGSLIEWTIPFAFFVCAGWTIWHAPAFILDLLPPQTDTLLSQISELHKRKDVTPDLSGLFGGYADIIDWGAILALPILFYFGARTVRVADMEFQDWKPIDRIALFIGRLTMILIISMTLVMLYEVFLRYIVERPTLWANELTLWIAGFVFLLSGIYAMQQRCHIRIFILYDLAPRWLQRVFDIVSVAMICTFTFFLIYGSFKQVFIVKFYRWEMFGTAFDPPIPATVQPMILITVVLISAQAIVNLICDWNKEPEVHTAASDIDEEELEAIKRSVGAK
ncbi:MAG: TRAP transporter small permease [Pseudomonadota bacterium]